MCPIIADIAQKPFNPRIISTKDNKAGKRNFNLYIIELRRHHAQSGQHNA